MKLVGGRQKRRARRRLKPRLSIYDVVRAHMEAAHAELQREADAAFHRWLLENPRSPRWPA